jgi:hypothetical protein
MAVQCLHRKVIPQNADGTWTLVEPLEITTPELAVKLGSQPRGFSVKAAEIHHIPELQCFGYTLQEPVSLPRAIDVEAARKLGVTSSDSYRILKSGFSVMNEDESRLVHADEVCGDPVRARKVTVLGDCCLVPPVMEMLAMNSDVLIHEATLSITETGKKAEVGGHSSAAQAAIFANKVKAQIVVLNHLPKILNTYSKCKEWLSEAESRIRGPTKVQLGYDHLEILIPRNGFDFDSIESSRSLWPDERQQLLATSKQHEDEDNSYVLKPPLKRVDPGLLAMTTSSASLSHDNGLQSLQESVDKVVNEPISPSTELTNEKEDNVDGLVNEPIEISPSTELTNEKEDSVDGLVNEPIEISPSTELTNEREAAL